MDMEDKIKYADPTSSFEYMSKEEAYERFGKEFVEEQLKNKNMEDKQQPTVGSLNEKIWDILKDEIYIEQDDDIIFGKHEAAIAIEQLILQEKIDLLNELWKTNMQSNKHIGIIFNEKITQLTNQLNTL